MLVFFIMTVISVNLEVGYLNYYDLLRTHFIVLWISKDILCSLCLFFFFTFYSLKNAEKQNVSWFPQKLLHSTTVFNIDNNKKYFEH